MPFIEVQFSTMRLFEILREAVREALIAVTVDEWSAVAPVGGTQTLMFERIDVRDNTAFVTSPSFNFERWDDWPYHSGGDAISEYPEVGVHSTTLAVTQDLDLHPVLVLGRGTVGVVLVRLAPVTVSVSVSVESVVVEDVLGPGQTVPRTHPALRFTADQVSFRPIPRVADPLAQRAEDAVSAAIGTRTQLLPDVPLGNLRFSNGGVALLGGGNRVAVRFQAGLGTEVWTKTQWMDFYRGSSPDLLEPAVGGNGGPRDWGVRMDASLLAMRMNAEVTQALSAPSSTVFLSNRGVQVSVGASGDHLGAVCTAFLEVATGVLGVTVVVELRLTVDLRTTGPGVLEAHAAIHIALVKSIDTAALLVVAGAAIGAALGLAAVIIPGGVVALPLIVIGGVVVLGSLGPLPVNVLPSSAGRTCSETGLTVDYLDLSADKSITCTMPVGERLPLTRNAALEMSSLFALGEDVVATGTISPLPTLPAPVWSLSTGDWDWEPPDIPCSLVTAAVRMVARFRDDPSAARCRTSIVLTSVTAGAVSIIDAYIASDSHGLASARVVGGIAVDVSVGYDAVFFGAEPTVSVLVHTTGGVQLVQLGPLPPLDVEGMARKMLGGIDDCFLREGRDFFSHFHKFNPKWAIDPYEHTQVVLHRWDTDVSGLEPDEVVELYGGSNGDRVSRVMATRDGSAQLSLLSRPVVGDGREFSLRRIGSDGGQIIGESNRPGEELGTEARVIRLTQTLLSHRSTVVLATSAVAIEVGLVSGTETLAVVRSSALDLYDVTAPDRPRLLASLEALDAVGTRIGRRGLFVWGPQGVDQLSAERTALGPYLRRLSNVRAYDVAVWRDHVVVLDLAGLASVDEAGQFIRYRSTAHGKSLAIVNGAVAVAGESSLDIFDLHNPSEPVGRIESFRCDRLFNATSSGAGSDLVAQTANGYVTVDLTDPTAPRVSTWHDSVPDRALVTDAGTVLVVASDNATSVELYTVSARRTY